MILKLIHIIFGHPYEGSEHVDKLRSEKHPHSDSEWVYTVNVRKCKCGLHFHDAGVESRIPMDELMKTYK